MHIANSDKPVALYSLDVILAVGYRANSKVAIEFRQWATNTLRAHIIEGYTINRRRISKNYESFLTAVEQIKALLPSGENVDTKKCTRARKTFLPELGSRLTRMTNLIFRLSALQKNR